MRTLLCISLLAWSAMSACLACEAPAATLVAARSDSGEGRGGGGGGGG